VPHRSRADDGGRDRRVAQYEGDGHLDEGHARLVGQPTQCVGRLELALVGGQRHVEAVDKPLA